MVHKKYSYKNGKKYGPYFYENTRVGEKVVTRYIGKEEEKRKLSFVNIGLLVLTVVLCFGLFYFLSLNMTGNIVLGLTSFLSPNVTCANCSLNGSIEISNVHSNNTDASLVSYWQFTSDARDSKGIYNLSVFGATKEHERYFFDGVDDYLNVSCNFNCIGTPDNSSCGQFGNVTSCDAYSSHGGECSSVYSCTGTPNTDCSLYGDQQSCNANTGGSYLGHYDGCYWTGGGDCTGTVTCEGQATQQACEDLYSAGGCSWNVGSYGAGTCSGTPAGGNDCSQWSSNGYECTEFNNRNMQCTWHDPTDDYRCAGTAGTPSCSVFTDIDSCGRENGCSLSWSVCSNVSEGLTCLSQSQSLGCSSLSGCSINVTSGFPLVGDMNWSVFSWIKTAVTGGNIFSIGDNGLAFLRLAISGTGNLETNANNPSPQLINNSYPLNDNQWHHVGLSYNGTYLSLFVDGNLSSVASTDPIELPCSTGFTAAYKPGSATNLAGRMDEIKVYNRSLNSSEAYDVFNSGLFQGSANYTSVFYDLGEPKNFKNVSWNANVQTIDTNSGLLFRFTMDSVNSSGDFVDSGPYSYNATKVGNVVQNDSGNIGKSAEFDGNGGYIKGPYIPLNNKSFSVSLWAYIDSLGSYSHGLFCQSQNTVTSESLLLLVGSDGAMIFTFYNEDLTTPAGTFSSNAWHHVVATYDISQSPIQRRLYVDGILIKSDTPSTLFSGTSGGTNIGSIYGDGYTWDGKIDEVLLYNRALSSYEVTKLYENSSKLSNYENMSDIQLQFRVASNPDSSSSYTVWENATNSSYSPLSLTSELILYRYIQFRAFFSSNYTSISPALNSINIYYNNNDTVAPLVTIVSPTNNSYVVPIIFNVSLNELGSVKFSLNNGTTNYTMSSLNNLNFNYTNSTLAPGSYTLKIYANDTSANRNYTESRNFTVDPSPPAISFLSPTTSSGTTTNNFILSLVEANASYYKNYSYYLYNSTGLVDYNRFYSDDFGVSAGNTYTCALLNNGNTTCQGFNVDGQSNNYTLGNAIGVSVGLSHTCVLLNNGNITCQGNNNYNKTNNYTLGNAISVLLGEHHTCALLNNGNITCWGRNNYGQSNNYTLGNAISVSVGSFGACALLNNGNITCQGYNGYGGANNYTQGNAIGVSSRYYTTCALLNNGNITCWGLNDYGQSNNYTLGNAISVSAGYHHTCALLNTGNITCWGDNSMGQSNNYTLGNAISVSAGYYHTCALLNNGNINCWGTNGNGQANNYTLGNVKKQALYAFLGLVNGTYYLNASACDTSNNCNWTETRTILIGITVPLVTIVSPSGTYTSDSYNINITLNEAGYCEYSLNSGSSNSSLSAGNSNKEFTATVSGVSNGDYTLSAYCNDSSGGKNYTESRSFTVSVSSVVVNGGGGGGGGGGATTPVGTPLASEATYSASDEQIRIGYRQALSDTESIKFFVNTQEHLVVLDKITEDKISITVSSTPQVMNISLGKQVDVDVDGDNVKDVAIGFWSIKDGKAEIFIKLATAAQSVNQTKGVNATRGGVTGGQFDLSDYLGIEWIIGLVVAILLVSFAIYRVVRRKLLERRWEKSRQQFKWRPVGEFKEETKKVD